ncbi:MAG: abortive infection family protein [Patescibacteria group bacterium]
MFSIINGISGFSNTVSDRHGKTSKLHKPDKHHAVLAVNTAKTMSEFLINSYEKQYQRN